MGHSRLIWNTARLQMAVSGGNTGTSGSNSTANNKEGNTDKAPRKEDV